MSLDALLSPTAFWTIIVALTCSTSCAVVGCYLVLRRMSMLGDAISHSVLPGIAIGVLISGEIGGLPAFLGALVFGLLTTILVQLLHSTGRLAEDSSMGVVFSTLFSLGVVLISREARHKHIDADCVLYGLIEAVSLDTVPVFGWEVPRALGTTMPVLIIVLVVVALLWKEFKIVSFDPALAQAMGYPVAWIHQVLMGLVAGVTVASFEAVGSILVIAMLIVPAATAQLLTDRLSGMMIWSIAIGAVASILGYYFAQILNTSVAGMMAVVAGGEFALALLAAPRHGLVSKAYRNVALGIRIVGEDMLTRLYRVEESRHEEALPDSGTAGASPFVRVAARQWLLRKGWIARGVSTDALTSAGRDRAAELIRSHRLWETYLGRNFDLPADHRHEIAERVEHFIDRDLQGEIARELENPGQDPEGRLIPPPR